jgi:hypothetical protein
MPSRAGINFCAKKLGYIYGNKISLGGPSVESGERTGEVMLVNRRNDNTGHANRIASSSQHNVHIYKVYGSIYCTTTLHYFWLFSVCNSNYEHCNTKCQLMLQH